jgi:BRCA1-associated protein
MDMVSNYPPFPQCLTKCRCSLICGNVGCGRYDEGHAKLHYLETSHCFAMAVDNQTVWDYAGDNWVHRLILNKSDGKLVELPSSLSRGNAEYTAVGDEYVPREKLDNIGMEYTYLLTSQLDSQRLYFEEKVAQAADKASKASQAAEQASDYASSLASQLDALKLLHDELSKDSLPSLERDRDRAARKAEKSTEMARKLEKEWREEKALAGSLMERVEHMRGEQERWQEERKKLMDELNDMKEQNRDLSFFISGQQKLKELEADTGESVAEESILVADAPEAKGKKKKGKGKK